MLSHAAEALLFKSDYTAWCVYVAPRWIGLMQSRDDVNRMWPIASQTLRDAIWAIADDEFKALIRRSRAGAKETSNEPAQFQPSLL